LLGKRGQPVLIGPLHINKKNIFTFLNVPPRPAEVFRPYISGGVVDASRSIVVIFVDIQLFGPTELTIDSNLAHRVPNTSSLYSNEGIQLKYLW
jgi:hypothetical protein